jgi:predicted ATPase/DNA-binding winged helix-turn-helix (wHTH) protein
VTVLQSDQIRIVSVSFILLGPGSPLVSIWFLLGLYKVDMASGNGLFRFGEFVLDIKQRLLMKNGRELPLTPKALALLMVLFENRGQIIERSDLIERVWTDTIVEEGNLAYTIRLLRKTLGDDPDSPKFIQTVPRRGYRFVAECYAVNEDPPKLVEGIYGNGLAEVVGSGLIGREKELAEITKILENDHVRLVTLTGPGGIGKTRLAKEVALLAGDRFSDGVIFVDLTAVTDPLLVPSAIANELGIREVGTSSTLDVLSEPLREKSSLLILDNFEQVVSAGIQLSQIVRDAPQLKILVTSREPLKISVETEYRVPPLAVPSIETKTTISDLMRFGSVQLFIQRARAARRDLELTDEDATALVGICKRLDGLPLALELAASRSKVLSIREIHSKLENRLALLTGGSRDMPDRQQTMRATIEWSYGLLTDREKRAFAQLSIFESGFTFNAAEKVLTNVDGDEPQLSETIVVDAVTSLTEKGLLQSEKSIGGEIRFRMLVVVRDFASEVRLRGNVGESISRSHADYFRDFAEAATPYYFSSGSAEWLDRLELERDNIRAAIRWSLENDLRMAARILASVRHFAALRFDVIETRNWLEEILKRSDEIAADVRCEMLTGLGIVSQYQLDYASARKAYEKNLAVCQTLSDKRLIARALRGLGAIDYMESDLASARDRINEALAISRSINDEFGEAAALARLGDISNAEREYAKARVLIVEALEIFRRLGFKEGVSSKLANLSITEFYLGNHASARTCLLELLNNCVEMNDEIQFRVGFEIAAALMAETGNFRAAARLAGATAARCEELAYFHEPVEQRFRDTYIAKLKNVMTESDFEAAYSEGRKMNVSETAQLALEAARSSTQAAVRLRLVERRSAH